MSLRCILISINLLNMSLFVHDSITDDALRVQMFSAGKGGATSAGWVHEKTVPYAIIAEATRGKYELECAGVRLVTRPGEAWVTAPGMPLRITHHPDPKTGMTTRYRYLHFTFTLHYSLDVSLLFRMPMKLKFSQCAEIGDIIEELHGFDKLKVHRDLRWQVRRQELAFCVLRILCEAAKPAPNASLLLAGTHRLKPLLAYLRDNLAKPITASDMAKVCHMSLSGFHRYFQKYADTSPVNYFKRLRLNEAARLLLSTDLTIAEVVYKTGFLNQFHFSREFKREYRQTPSIYREETYRRHDTI